jgi:hypothetical protein
MTAILTQFGKGAGEEVTMLPCYFTFRFMQEMRSRMCVIASTGSLATQWSSVKHTNKRDAAIPPKNAANPNIGFQRLDTRQLRRPRPSPHHWWSHLSLEPDG